MRYEKQIQMLDPEVLKTLAQATIDRYFEVTGKDLLDELAKVQPNKNNINEVDWVDISTRTRTDRGLTQLTPKDKKDDNNDSNEEQENETCKTTSKIK